jgi:hypothetical protein
MQNAAINSPGNRIAGLAHRLQLVRGHRLLKTTRVLPTGISVLDEFLPSGGLLKGAINEWVGAQGKYTLASCVLAFHSHSHPVAFLGTDGIPHPLLMERAGGMFSNLYLAVESSLALFARLVEQVAGAAVFPLIVIQASRWNSGEPLFSAPSLRRLFSMARGTGCTLLFLLEDHGTLSSLTRSCSLRLRFSPVGNEMGRCSIELERLSGYSPGGQVALALDDVVASVKGRAS